MSEEQPLDALLLSTVRTTPDHDDDKDEDDDKGAA